MKFWPLVYMQKQCGILGSVLKGRDILLSLPLLPTKHRVDGWMWSRPHWRWGLSRQWADGLCLRITHLPGNGIRSSPGHHILGKTWTEIEHNAWISPSEIQTQQWYRNMLKVGEESRSWVWKHYKAIPALDWLYSQKNISFVCLIVGFCSSRLNIILTHTQQSLKIG